MLSGFLICDVAGKKLFVIRHKNSPSALTAGEFGCSVTLLVGIAGFDGVLRLPRWVQIMISIAKIKRIALGLHVFSTTH